MQMKYYNPSNNFKAPIPREPKPFVPPEHKEHFCPPELPIVPIQSREEEYKDEQIVKHKKKIDFNQDDLILLGLIIILLLNSCDDYLLLLILGYILLSGKQVF